MEWIHEHWVVVGLKMVFTRADQGNGLCQHEIYIFNTNHSLSFQIHLVKSQSVPMLHTGSVDI